MFNFHKSSLTRELPLNVPYPAKAQLFQKCFLAWPDLSKKCFELVCTLAAKSFTDIASSIFAPYKVLHAHVR